MRPGPSSSATTSTTDQAVPSSAVQVRCWSRPITMARLPLASDRVACSAWSRHTITVKNDSSCSQRPRWPPGTWPGRSRPRCAAARVVGGVAGEAHGCPGHDVPVPVAWPGGLPCPWNPGDGGHHGMPPDPQEQAAEPTKSAIDPDRRPWPAQVLSWLAALAAGGWACRHRPARSLHPGCGGRTRLPPRGPLAGPFQVARDGSSYTGLGATARRPGR